MKAKKHMIFPVLALKTSKVHVLAVEEPRHSRAVLSSTNAMITTQLQTTVNNSVCLFLRCRISSRQSLLNLKIQMRFHGREIRSIRLSNV